MMDLSAYNLTALFEAILFASPDPVSIEKLISFSDCSKEAADEALAELASRYSNENSGIELIIKSDSCTLGAKLIYGEALSGFFKTRKSAFLSNAALEVLAIAAYNQPVTKTYISQIRGIPSSEIVESLLDKNF